MDESLVVFHEQIPTIKRRHIEQVQHEKMSILAKNKGYIGEGIVSWDPQETKEILQAIEKWMIKELQICSVQASLIKCIKQIKMPRLTTLWTENCQLNSIEGLCRVDLPSLRKLYIMNNNIRKISELRKVDSRSLHYVNLSNNCIQQWCPLTQLPSECMTGLTLHNDEKAQRQCEGLGWAAKLKSQLQFIQCERKARRARISKILCKKYNNINLSSIC